MDFIDGVILIEECTSLSTLWLAVLIIVAAAPMAIMIIVTIVLMIIKGVKVYTELYEEKMQTIYIFCLLWGCMIAGLLCTSLFEPLYKPDGRYVVAVTEDTDMNEFAEKYEILDYEDGKYTIRMR